MKLGEKQELFAVLLAKLLAYAHTFPDTHIRLKELLRTKEMAEIYAKQGKGIINSVHLLGIAIDLVLRIEDEIITDSSKYEFLGVYWESLHPLCRWGGRFKRVDGGHFSLEHEGRC